MAILFRIIHTVLALLLLTSVSGLSIHQHLCRGEVMSTSLLPASPACMPAQADCSATKEVKLPLTGGQRMEQPCCDNRVQRFQVEDEFQPAPFTLTSFAPLLIFPAHAEIAPVLLQSVALPIQCHSPPLPASRDLLAWNQVFRL